MDLVITNKTSVDEVLAYLAKDIPSDKDYTCFEQLFVHIEEAFWVYNDIYRPNGPNLPSFSLRDFADKLLQYNQSLLPFYHGLLNVYDFDQMMTLFAEYKRALPRFGACLLNPELDSVVLVKEKGGWGFPRGKRADGESEEQCAIREVMEEIGVDISDKLVPDLSISQEFHGSFFKFFVVPNISKEISFAPTTRHEIQQVAWHTISLLPQNRHMNAKAFFMTIPFIRKLKECIVMYATSNKLPLPLLSSRQKKSHKSPKNNLQHTAPTETNTTDSTSPQNTPIPLKKRKLDDLNKSPITAHGIQFVSPGTPKSPRNPKPAKSWLIEWCQKNKVAPVFSRESIPKTPSSSSTFTVTLRIPAPYNCVFTSPEPALTARDAENSACKVALHHLDRERYQQMEGLPSQSTNIPKASADPTKLTFVETDDPFTIPNSLPVDPNQETVPQANLITPLPQKALENPLSFLKETCDKRKWPNPTYETVRTEGPAHLRLYVVEVTLPTGKFRSDRGYSTLQLARKHAATAALLAMHA
eukprot:Phypoly_transcript_05035.p1 GENE.Phypoly_transcript_05035~~Phypoly_transcript_05035.p1  ORF type:complete len:528 (+),score=96.53 Phypoly_transcript_05035:158-1741(+)